MLYAHSAFEGMAAEQYVPQDLSYENPHTKIINLSTVILHGKRDTKRVALTFDADMTYGMKEAILAGKINTSIDESTIQTLIKTRTKATLFLTGLWMELYPEQTKQLAKNPLFELGNHSYSHGAFDGFCFGLKPIPDTEKKGEIHKTQLLLKAATGIDNKLFRFPGGCYAKKDLEYTKQEGLVVIHWDTVGQDGFNNNSSSIEKNVLDHVKNGSIIVLHVNGAPTAPKTSEALPSVISTLKNRGYEFVKVSELLEL